jgi:hypothetical protein
MEKENMAEIEKPKMPPVIVEEVESEIPEFIDLTPSNWVIKPLKDGIEARNSLTGETFEGTVAEFNEALRG